MKNIYTYIWSYFKHDACFFALFLLFFSVILLDAKRSWHDLFVFIVVMLFPFSMLLISQFITTWRIFKEHDLSYTRRYFAHSYFIYFLSVNALAVIIYFVFLTGIEKSYEIPWFILCFTCIGGMWLLRNVVTCMKKSLHEIFFVQNGKIFMNFEAWNVFSSRNADWYVKLLLGLLMCLAVIFLSMTIAEHEFSYSLFIARVVCLLWVSIYPRLIRVVYFHYFIIPAITKKFSKPLLVDRADVLEDDDVLFEKVFGVAKFKLPTEESALRNKLFSVSQVKWPIKYSDIFPEKAK